MTWDRWLEVVATVVPTVAVVFAGLRWLSSRLRALKRDDGERPGDVLGLRQPEDDGPLEVFVINPFGDDGYDDDDECRRRGCGAEPGDPAPTRRPRPTPPER